MDSDHARLGPLGWVLYGVAGIASQFAAHWVQVLTIVCALTGTACHVIQTWLRWRAERERRQSEVAKALRAIASSPRRPRA